MSYSLPYTLFENPMTFNVFGLLKILSYLNDEIMNVPKKIINKRDEGDFIRALDRSGG